MHKVGFALSNFMKSPKKKRVTTSSQPPPPATGNSETELQWYFGAVKGDTDNASPAEDDMLSCVEFNETGDLLATGDKGGRVVVFQRDANGGSANYSVYSTFQSHEAEFDYLKSQEIDEKINQIKWVSKKNNAHFLLSTNDKTIKLWKMQERTRRSQGCNLRDERGFMREPGSIKRLTVPTIVPSELVVEASQRRVFANAHTYHINSVSVNSDQETFITADDLRINLWHMDVTNQSFNIVDLKPANMEELSEVITAAEFHPTDCHIFAHSSSKGVVRLCDMRQRALCDQHALMLEEAEDASNKSFFSEIICSISDLQFSRGSGRYLMTRDFMSLKIWDVQMPTRPVETYPVHEYLRGKLCTLYENDCLFDKFTCCWNRNNRYLLTGSYNGSFKLFDRESKVETMLEVTKECEKLSSKQPLKPRKVFTGSSGKKKKDELAVDSFDFTKKVVHTAWHPEHNVIALTGVNNLYLFNGKD